MYRLGTRQQWRLVNTEVNQLGKIRLKCRRIPASKKDWLFLADYKIISIAASLCSTRYNTAQNINCTY